MVCSTKAFPLPLFGCRSKPRYLNIKIAAKRMCIPPKHDITSANPSTCLPQKKWHMDGFSPLIVEPINYWAQKNCWLYRHNFSNHLKVNWGIFWVYTSILYTNTNISFRLTKPICLSLGSLKAWAVCASVAIWTSPLRIEGGNPRQRCRFSTGKSSIYMGDVKKCHVWLLYIYIQCTC